MCRKCQSFGGLWQEMPSGLTRCDCAQGQSIRDAEARRQNPARKPPAMTKEEAAIFAEMLSVVPFYPKESGGRILVGEEIRSMCANAEEAMWLVQRMARKYKKWPGLDEMRRMYCSKYIPLDGEIDETVSSVYPDGIPSETKRIDLLIDGPKEQKLLPAGNIASVGRRTDAAMRVAVLAEHLKSLALVGPATKEEIESAPEWLRSMEGYE